MMNSDPTSYIDEIYEYDIIQRPKMENLKEEDRTFLSGSAAEGAHICRGIWEVKTNVEMDVMRPFGTIPRHKSEHILVPTGYIGYYHLRWDAEMVSCLDERFSELLAFNDCNEVYLDSQILKLYHKMSQVEQKNKNKSTSIGNSVHYSDSDYKDGTPNIYTDMNFMLHLETDYILCIELAFWPEIVSPWFKRKRYWPCPEIVEEINRKNCHLVLKSSQEAKGSNDQWRISFSKAECILSKGKTHFQNKCYILAKFFYYAHLKQTEDKETGRHISSYLLKTTMLHMLEQTSHQQWRDWEGGKRYVEVVFTLYQRLIDSLTAGYLPSYFVDEINLLEGYSTPFLDEMADQVNQLCDNWKTPKGEEFFHSCIKGMFHNIKTKMETPEAKAAVLAEMAKESNFSFTQDGVNKMMNDHMSMFQDVMNMEVDPNASANDILRSTTQSAMEFQKKFATKGGFGVPDEVLKNIFDTETAASVMAKINNTVAENLQLHYSNQSQIDELCFDDESSSDSEITEEHREMMKKFEEMRKNWMKSEGNRFKHLFDNSSEEEEEIEQREMTAMTNLHFPPGDRRSFSQYPPTVVPQFENLMANQPGYIQSGGGQSYSQYPPTVVPQFGNLMASQPGYIQSGGGQSYSQYPPTVVPQFGNLMASQSGYIQSGGGQSYSQYPPTVVPRFENLMASQSGYIQSGGGQSYSQYPPTVGSRIENTMPCIQTGGFGPVQPSPIVNKSNKCILS